MSEGTFRLGSVAVALALAVACGGSESPNEPGPSAGAGRAGGSSEAGEAGEAGAGQGGASSAGTLGAGGGGQGAGAPSEGGAAGMIDAAGEGGAGGSSGTGGSSGVTSAGEGGAAGEQNAAGAAGEPNEGGAAGAPEDNPDALLFDVNIVRSIDIDPAAPGTIGIVTFSVDVPDLVEASIEFGLDRSYGMVAPVDLGEPDYRTVVLGMKPSRTYHLRVVVRDATRSYRSADYTLLTGPPPSVRLLSDFSVIDEGARERGFLVASFWQGLNATIPFIIDADGDIVWWYTGLPIQVARARMSADGQNLWLAPSSNLGAPLRRIRIDGLEVQTYDGTSASHDITPVSGSTMAYLDYGETDCDSIFEIDPSGTTREVFESQGIVDSGTEPLDCHGNALRYSAAEDLFTFSEWQQDILAVRRDGTVAWRLTDRVTGGVGAWGGFNHGHHLLAGSLLLFANRATDGGSQAIEYGLDGAELRRFPSHGFTSNLGDVQRLPAGNTLITYSNDSYLEEVTPDGTAVLSIEGTGRFGYVSWRPSLYGPTPECVD